MIQFLYGRAGSGKTAWITQAIRADIEHGHSVMVLVPEQEVLFCEQALSVALDGLPLISLEVLSFRRLANLIFRKYGGLSYHCLGRGAQALLLWKALKSCAGQLTEYRSVSLADQGFLYLMLDTITEFSICKITPEQLQKTADAMESSLLKRKLEDFAILYAVYLQLLHQDYDDVSDELSRAADLVQNRDFFANKRVYLDSFHTFSPQEYALLRPVFTQSEHVTVAMSFLPKQLEITFASVAQTAKKLHDLATEAGCDIAPDICRKDLPRFESSDLALLSTYLWRMESKAIATHSPQNIRVVACADPFEEAEIIAADIHRRVRTEGLRYRDFAIFTRSLQRYDGILDVVMEKYKIPCYFSKRQALSNHPLLRVLQCALQVLDRKFRFQDMIAYLKTERTGLTLAETQELTEYATTWKITGLRWVDGVLWTMNPEGFSDVMTEESAQLLVRVNAAKEKLVAPLLRLSAAFTENASVREVSCAIIRFFDDLQIRASLEQSAQTDDAKIEITVWNALMDTMDQLVQLLLEVTVTPRDYHQLLSVLIREADYGTIPPTMDQVVFGDAAQMRTAKLKGVYIIGANEGIFPMNGAIPNLLNDHERKRLHQVGITLLPDSVERSREELFYAYRAVSAPSSFLTVTYAKENPDGTVIASSVLPKRILTLFPQLQEEDAAQFPLTVRAECAESAVEMLSEYDKTESANALRTVLCRQEAYAKRLQYAQMPLKLKELTLSEAVIKKCYPADLAVTQARLDSYVKCKFSHQCRYLLKLKEPKAAEFQQVDTGNFVHRILETVLSRLHTPKGLRTDLTDQELEWLTDTVIADYIRHVCGTENAYSKRLENLFRRLRKNTLLLLRNLLHEFSQSQFIPQFFEMPIQKNQTDSATPLEIPLADGTHIFVYGKIDRVDTYTEGETVYLRIVDYKTGSKQFRLSDIQQGLNLQMLLYLFSLWNAPPRILLDAAGVDENATVLPAGILYFSAKPAPQTLSAENFTTENAMKAAEASLGRSGLLLAEEPVLRAMEQNLEGRYLPVSAKDLEHPEKVTSLTTLAEFGALMQNVSGTVAKIGEQIKQGISDAIPRAEHEVSPCTYCAYGAVCRHTEE